MSSAWGEPFFSSLKNKLIKKRVFTKSKQTQEAERKRRKIAFMLGMGLRMMGGQSASEAAIDQSVGAPMY